jgi:hypothetical protein
MGVLRSKLGWTLVVVWVVALDDDRFYRRWEIETPPCSQRLSEAKPQRSAGLLGLAPYVVARIGRSGGWEAPVGGIRTPFITRPVCVPAPLPARTMGS